MELAGGFGNSQQSGTSIFDPVVCELAYRWFCPPGGVVLDPFAGGSVRGIVASHLGREYHGVELRPEQVKANEAQKDIAKEPRPQWYCGDSRGIGSICSHVEADFVFSCPPYAHLERYSDDPRDLSTMDYPSFVESYRHIIAQSAALLRDNRFGCFVVGDVRDKKGNYLNFVGDTVEAFRAAGMHLYNEAILLTAVGSLPVRVNKQFQSGRKLGKTHQNVLVFVKGDGKKAATACTLSPAERGTGE
jgi:DNA modification methylase